MTERVFSVVVFALMPFLLTGIITRVKSLWSGRRGPPLLQPAFDVIRLMKKTSVYSLTTTPLFRIAPWVFLVTAIGSACVTPLLGTGAMAPFAFDFVWFAYVAALGRVAIMLAALDTGSAFQGMGTAREATFSSILEPALFLVTGALCLHGGVNTLHEALVVHTSTHDASLIVWFGSVTALFIVLQVDSARMPIDDPTTHLELTMVHEVMVLDHSGPDLAAIQTAAAIKLYVGASILATLLNPFAGEGSVVTGLVNLLLVILVGVALGTIESLIARFRLRSVPQYIAIALGSSTLALLATAWRAGVSP